MSPFSMLQLMAIDLLEYNWYYMISVCSSLWKLHQINATTELE